MKDHSKCDKCHEERQMRLERVLGLCVMGRGWEGRAVRAEGWGWSFQARAGGGHSKSTGSMAGWSMAHRWVWWGAAGPKQGSPMQVVLSSLFLIECQRVQVVGFKKKSKSNPGERIQSPPPSPLGCPSCPPSCSAFFRGIAQLLSNPPLIRKCL